MTRVEAAAYGLALCYLANDTEELFTYAESSKELLARMPAWVPVPDAARRDGWTQDHVDVAVALIGVHWVGAALAGRRTGGRSAWFQNALCAWGLHGFGHLGMSLAARRYTSGVATAPLVIGYWFWARRELRASGVPDRVSPIAVAAQLPMLAAVHAVAELLTRSRIGAP